jgi:hypothetical protein
MFRGKALLDRAVELEEIYGKSQVNINLVRTDKANIVCYRCQEKGHYANDCRAQNKPSQNNNNNSQNNNNNTDNNTRKQNTSTNKNQRSQNGYQNNNSSSTNMFHLNKIEYTNAITGSCMLDGQSTHFMMDTGANKTVIDVKLLSEEQRKEIRHVPFTVILADGSRVPAMGLRKSLIKLGSHELEVDVLVTENLHEGCLLGIDFLARCPMTKDLIEQLRHVACESSVHEVNEVHTFLIKSTQNSQ